MGNWQTSTAAATAVIGFDLFDGEAWNRSSINRVIRGFGFTGSAVVGDAEVEVFVGEKRVGNYFNNKLLAPNTDDVFSIANERVPQGVLVRCVVKDAPATSVVFTVLQIEDA